MQSNLLTFFYI